MRMDGVEAALEWASAQVGERLVAVAPERWHQSESGGRVIPIEASAGPGYALKLFGPGRSYRQAKAAHDDWALGERSIGVQVRAWSPELRASLTRWWPQGRGSLDNKALHDLGALLGRLHATAIVDDDPVTLCEALEARVGGLLQRLDSHLGSQRRRRVEGRLPLWTAAWAVPRVACHRDFRPRNCLLTTHGWRLIDFEHARADAYAVDLAAALETFGAAAFAPLIAGYSEQAAPPAVQFKAGLEAARVLRALQSMSWDEADRTRSQSALAQLDLVLDASN